MSSRVYSFGMLRGTASPGSPVTVTVPHGFVFVVKCFTAYASPTFGETRVFFEEFDDTVTYWSDAVDRGSHIVAVVPCTITLNEGETFGFRVASNYGEAADVSASGYALTLP